MGIILGNMGIIVGNMGIMVGVVFFVFYNAHSS